MPYLHRLPLDVLAKTVAHIIYECSVSVTIEECTDIIRDVMTDHNVTNFEPGIFMRKVETQIERLNNMEKTNGR